MQTAHASFGQRSSLPRFSILQHSTGEGSWPPRTDRDGRIQEPRHRQIRFKAGQMAAPLAQGTAGCQSCAHDVPLNWPREPSQIGSRRRVRLRRSRNGDSRCRHLNLSCVARWRQDDQASWCRRLPAVSAATPAVGEASPAALQRGAGRDRRPARPRSRVHNRNHQVRLLPPPHQLSAYGEPRNLMAWRSMKPLTRSVLQSLSPVQSWSPRHAG
jgi:hypothetical protein